MLFDVGFDTVELVIAVEETFGLSIPDRDAEKIQTAGQLSEYITAAVGATLAETPDRCLSAAAFYQTRRWLAPTIGVSRREIRPSTPMELFLPQTGRREAWKELGELLGVRLPRMEFPARLAALPLLGLGAAVIAGAALHSTTLVWSGVLGVIPCFLLLGIGELLFGTQVPQRYRTVGEISALLMPSVLAHLNPDSRRWTEQEIWQLIRHLTAHSAGVSPSKISRDTNWSQLV